MNPRTPNSPGLRMFIELHFSKFSGLCWTSLHIREIKTHAKKVTTIKWPPNLFRAAFFLHLDMLFSLCEIWALHNHNLPFKSALYFFSPCFSSYPTPIKQRNSLCRWTHLFLSCLASALGLSFTISTIRWGLGNLHDSLHRILYNWIIPSFCFTEFSSPSEDQLRHPRCFQWTLYSKNLSM